MKAKLVNFVEKIVLFFFLQVEEIFTERIFNIQT